jgi:hypothetical protein
LRNRGGRSGGKTLDRSEQQKPGGKEYVGHVDNSTDIHERLLDAGLSFIRAVDFAGMS